MLKAQPGNTFAIIGSDDYQFTGYVADSIRNIIENDDEAEIVVGDYDGVSRAAIDEAADLGLDVSIYAPNTQEYGNLADEVLIKKMITLADRVVVFWNGVDDRTRTAIKECFLEKDPEDFKIHVEHESVVDELYKIDDEADFVEYVSIDDWVAKKKEEQASLDDDTSDNCDDGSGDASGD